MAFEPGDGAGRDMAPQGALPRDGVGVVRAGTERARTPSADDAASVSDRRFSDHRFMAACLALARRGLGQTAPNPSVAALVVDGAGRVLGRGITAPGGRPHAEARALAMAGSAARGATLYVSLEPCATRSQRVFGPSCTEAILEAGIARVVVATADPSPHAAGAGIARLSAAGVAVTGGVLDEEGARIIAGHAMRVTAARPFVTVKLAMTADGFAATEDRRPIAITGAEARGFTHRLRAMHDAILVGIGTVLADDPLLTCRLPGLAGRSPLRVVLDAAGQMPEGAAMLHAETPGSTLVATAVPERLAGRLGPRGEILVVPESAPGRLDLGAVLGALAARGLTRLMVEGGPTVAESFATAGLIDDLVLLEAPQARGTGLPALGPRLRAMIGAEQAVPRRMAAFGADRATFLSPTGR